MERALVEAAPEIVIIDVEEPSDHAVATPIALIAKPGMTYDPATGCGAAFEADLSVS